MAKVKTTVGEWRRYMNATWEHPDAWMEEEVIEIDGEVIDDDAIKENTADATVITVTGGTVMFPAETGIEDIDLPKHFKRWIKAQSTAFVLVEVDKTEVNSFKDLVKSFGAKVVS